VRWLRFLALLLLGLHATAALAARMPGRLPARVWHSPEEIDLFAAAQRDEVKALERLLTAGAGANTRNRRGMTVLMEAARAGSLGTMRRLVTAGADVNARQPGGMTPLLYAALAGDRAGAAMRLLLEADADPNSADREGSTPLLLAVSWASQYEDAGARELVAALVRAGADVRATDRQGETPLLAVIRKGFPLETVRLLLERGADVIAANREGMTPLLLCLWSWDSENDERWDLLRLLLDRGARLRVEDRAGQTPLVAACERSDPDLVRFLLARGAALQAPRAREGNALCRATAHSTDEEIPRLLVEAGIDVNSRGNMGETPLMKWVERGSLDFVRTLLTHGADATARDETGRTVLMHPWYGTAPALDEHWLKLLIAHGADPFARDAARNTPLMYQSREGRIEAVRRLLELGVPVRAVNVRGEDALDWALRPRPGAGEPLALVQMLLRAGADARRRTCDGVTRLLRAAEYGFPACARLFVDLGNDVNARDAEGKTVLMHAGAPRARGFYREGKADLVRFLLARGAAIDGADRRGRTVLHHSLRSTHAILDDPTREVLLQAGADPNRPDGEGISAMTWAARYAPPETLAQLQRHGGCIRLAEAMLLDRDETALRLLREGASPEARVPGGHTVLTWAVERGKVPLAQALLEAGARPEPDQPYGYTPLIAAVGGLEGVWPYGIPSEKRTGSLGRREAPERQMAMADREAMVRLLLAHRARPDRRNAFGETALMWAAEYGFSGCVEALLEAGATPRLRDRQGKTAERVARSYGRWEIVKRLAFPAPWSRSR
jgi:ankyrin repeat protein